MSVMLAEEEEVDVDTHGMLFGLPEFWVFVEES